jgi:hypothetical protein
MKLSCHKRIDLGNRRGLSRRIYVIDDQGQNVPAYEFLTDSLDSDVQGAEGSGATALEWLVKVERGEVDSVEEDGNAWITHLSRDKVWFEGLYSQGEGGEVTFNQYKFALQTFVKFLADPEHKPIEVDFPDH